MKLRSYQLPVYRDHTTGVLILHWSRQIGKSFVLAAWAVERLITRPGRLVTVLSNSRDNGAEFLTKCAEICQLRGFMETRERSKEDAANADAKIQYRAGRFEVQITVEGKRGRIKVLAANSRTARGFSGDLILDEFAFHEDSEAIWEAAEPILASHADFLCRIASTGNGRHNLFYRMALPAVGSPPAPGLFPDSNADPSTETAPTSSVVWPQSAAGYPLSRVSRTDAWKQGVLIYDPLTRQPIAPEEARARAMDKRAYDQNYELSFHEETLALLTLELVTAAETEGVGFVADQDWPPAALELFRSISDRPPRLYAGVDVGRHRDLTVVTVMEKAHDVWLVRGVLRLDGARFPRQQACLAEVCGLPGFARMAIDMTGLGMGLFEYVEEAYGKSRVQGVNFSASVPVSASPSPDGGAGPRARVTEALAMELLRVYEQRRIRHPADRQLRDDLRKPEKRTTPGGRVSIAASRDKHGHADHFWSFALALEAGRCGLVEPHIVPVAGKLRAIAARRNRHMNG